MVVETLSLVQKGQMSGCSGIAVYGWGTLSFVQKGQISGCSGRVVYGGGSLSSVHKRSNLQMQ